MSLTDLDGGVDGGRLDDPAIIEAGDPAGMLRDIATSGAQVRAAVSNAHDAGFPALAADGRPRSFVIAGMGGSGISGDVVAAIAGPGCPAPVITHRGFGLPGWVGPADLVAVVSCSGATEETLSAAEEAARRGARLVGVGADGSPLADVVRRARAPYVVVPTDSQPRAMVWALSVPLLVAAQSVGLLPGEGYDAAADLLDQLAERCRPGSETFVNPAKLLAVELSNSLPMVWGNSPVAGVASYRFGCQLAENAKYPAVTGVMPEALHNQVVSFAGTFATAGADDEDFFRDRVEQPDATSVRLRLVLLRDTDELPRIEARRDAVLELTQRYGVPVTEITSEGSTPLERLASLVAIGDFASVYLALLLGIDPTPVAPIADIKAGIAR